MSTRQTSPLTTDLKVGLVGYASKTGLGYENLRMWNRLPFDRWLVIPNRLRDLDAELLRHARRADGTDCPSGIWVFDPDQWRKMVTPFLTGLDAVVCVEQTFPNDLFARAVGTRRVLLVNHEWITHDLPWLDDADVLVGRTLCGLFGLSNIPGLWQKTIYCPVPLDLEELPFRLRTSASKFMYSDGHGGVRERKGWPEVRVACAHSPLLLTVFTQRLLRGAEGFDVRLNVETPADLYREHDVAVQPSRFEGVGLSILEAMASGLVVMTTNAHPMRDYLEKAYGQDAERLLVKVGREEVVRLRQDVTACLADPDDLLGKIADLVGQPIAELSRRGREYVESTHGSAAWERLWKIVIGEVRPCSEHS